MITPDSRSAPDAGLTANAPPSAPTQPLEHSMNDTALLSLPMRSQLAIEMGKLYRHRLAMVGAVALLVVVTAALLAPWIAPYPFDAQNLDHIRAAGYTPKSVWYIPSSSSNPLGTRKK